ncbi:MAG: chorismate synthase [Clostridiales bacterium]|nr:chorismate synthase [Clostridiales bacterium]
MSNTIGKNIKVTVFGQSHSPAIGVVIDGFPSGVKVDDEYVKKFMARRAPGGAFSTPRKEGDEVTFISGLNALGETCGAPICGVIQNTNVKSKDYSDIEVMPRPSHSDFTSLIKYGLSRDVRGGGQFSGRLTAPLCIAGALCKKYLEEKGVFITAHLRSVGGIEDKSYDPVSNDIEQNLSDFPALDSDVAEKMKSEIESARLDGDSVGATIECKVVGTPLGLGDPMFCGVESILASAIFSIPAVKGFEVGSGFYGSTLRGSQNNDPLCIKNGEIKTVTNNAGGINGGITNGMPLTFNVAFKPTPSILKPQQSVNINTKEECKLQIKGRHDPCIGVRAVPVVEAVTAIVIADMILDK